jgi:hypothetical protein
MRRLIVPLTTAMLAASATPEGQNGTPPLPELLRGAATYVERFEHEFSFIVGEERYVQQVERRKQPRFNRNLVSNLFFMWVPDGLLLITARNVRTVDNEVVTDSVQRLERLLSNAGAEPSVKQRLLRDETTRFNVGGIFRNFSDPTLVVQFLHPRLQSRFLFRMAGRANIDGVPTWRLTYVERGSPTVISLNGGDARASGNVWIAANGGAVVRTTLRLSEVIPRTSVSPKEYFEARLEMTYGRDGRLDVWAPRTMTERYTLLRDGGRDSDLQEEERISSTASYSNFRRFETSGRLLAPDEPR